MAVSHVKSNAVADFTGTVTVFNSLGATTTTLASALVRPSDWNSAHNQFMTIAGNTAGASTLSGTNIVLQGGNNVTLSANGSTIVFSGPNQSVQTQSTVAVQGSTGAISFANSNGITFGGNASTITASHNGLTTARASNDGVGLNTALTAGPLAWTVNSSGISLNAGSAAGTTTAVTGRASITLNTAGLQFNGSGLAGTGFTSTTTAGTAIVATQNSAGLSIGVPAFLTAAAGGGPAISAAGGSQSTGTVVFSNSNGVSFGFNAGTITATVNPGAAAGIAAIGAGTQTGTSGTLVFSNSNGVSFGLSGSTQITASHNGLTTQSGQAFSADASSTFQTLTFQDSNGISFSNNAGALRLTHALQFTSNTSAITSNAAGTATAVTGRASLTLNTAGLSFNGAGLAGTGYTSTTTAGTQIVATNNTAGLSLAFPTIVTNALTTARASTDAVGLNTAQTNVTWTVNSSGISLNAAAYLTSQSNQAVSNSAGSFTFQTLNFSNANNVTFGTSAGGVITASVAAPGAATITAYAVSNTTQSTSGTIPGSVFSIQANGGVSAGVSNGSIVISGPALTSLSVTGALSASSNGSTISLGVGTVTVSATGNTTQASSGTVNLNALVLQGTGGVSVGVSNGSLVFSGATGGAGGNNAVNLLGANTSGNTTATGSTLGFSGVNLTLSGTNGSQVVFSAPATSSLVGGANITVSTAGSTISIIGASVAASPLSISAGTTSSALQSLVFSNSNGLSFGLNGSTITGSHNGLTTARASNDGVGLATAQSNVTWTVNSAGISLNAAGYAGTGTSATNASITLNSNGLAISVAAPGGGGGVALSAGTQSVSTGTMVFANSNGVTFGMSGSSQITASHNGLTTARASNDAVGLNTALTAGPLAWTVNSSGISLNAGSAAGTTSGFAGNLISGSMTHNTAGLNLSLNHPAWLTTAAQSSASNVSAVIAATNNTGGGTATLSGAVSFTNANSVTFYTSAGNAIALSLPAYLTTARASNDAVGLATALTAGPLAWTVNSAGLSLNAGSAAGTSTGFAGANISGSITHNTAGINLSLSVAAPGGGGGIALANTQTTYTSGTAQLFEAGGAITIASTTGQRFNFSVPATSSLSGTGAISLSTNGSTISIGVGTVTASAVGNTTQTSSGTINLNALQLSGAGNVSVGFSAGSVIISGGTAAAAPINFSAGTTSSNLGSVVFSNSNGVSFGLNGSTITAQHNGLTTARASNDGVGLNTALTAGPLAWTVNSSGISLNAGSAAGTTSGFTGGASISGSMTHNTAGLALSLSHPAWITTAALSNHSHGASASNGSFAFQTLAFSNANNVTFGTSAGSIITASVAAPGGGGGVALSAGTQSVSTGTVAFSNSNGITFGMSGSNQITASYNSTQFAGLGTTFQGNNASGSMTLNSAGLNLSVSVAAPGAAAENNAIQLLGANTAGNTTATGSTIGWSGLNLTLSGTNASQVVISAPATSSLVGASGLSISTNGSTISVYQLAGGLCEVFELGNNTAFSTMGQGTIYFQQFVAPQNVTFENIVRNFSGSSVSSTNSQVAAHTYSYGLYSRQTGASSTQYTQIAASSIYFAASYNSNTTAGWTVSQGAASVTNASAGTVNLSAITGLKQLYFPFAGTVTEGGQYAVAMWMSSATTGGTSPLRIGLMEMTNINNLTIGRLDTAAGFSISNASRIGDFGQGVYSSSSSNLPATLALSGLTNAVSQARMYLQLD